MQHTHRARFRAAGLVASALFMVALADPGWAQMRGDAEGSPEAVSERNRTSAVATVAAGVRGEAARAAVAAATDLAVLALSPEVARLSDSRALRQAFRAYYAYRAANAAEVRKPYLYFVDLGLDNGTARGYVFDMEALRLVEGPFHVAHGRGSLKGRNGVPTSFSNRPGSNASSLGVYLAQETYTFRGKLAGSTYSSVGLRMRGESGAFNDAARSRGIVAHGAPYVSASDAGRSEGCPAMEMARAERLLPLIANGGVVLIYSPNDRNWLTSDPWLNGGIGG